MRETDQMMNDIVRFHIWFNQDPLAIAQELLLYVQLPLLLIDDVNFYNFYYLSLVDPTMMFHEKLLLKKLWIPTRMENGALSNPATLRTSIGILAV